MVTSPITTAHFHSRVLALLSSTLSQRLSSTYDTNDADMAYVDGNPVIIPPLSPVDTPLTPNESMSQVVAVSSAWTDLCSPDPLIADISKQVLRLELTYAAFCGVTSVIIPGPRIHHPSPYEGGLMQYARAMLEALSLGPYLQMHIWMPLIDHPDNDVEQIGDLAPFARRQWGGLGTSYGLCVNIIRDFA